VCGAMCHTFLAARGSPHIFVISASICGKRRRRSERLFPLVAMEWRRLVGSLK